MSLLLDDSSSDYTGRQIQCLIKEHQSSNKGNKFWDDFDPETCTWQQVSEAAVYAEAEYEGKASGNHIRRVFRGESLARNITPLLESLPENDGLGFLKGGLIIVFNVSRPSPRSDHPGCTKDKTR